MIPKQKPRLIGPLVSFFIGDDSYLLPDHGRFTIGWAETCSLRIPGFARDRFCLFLRDSVNEYDEIRFLPGMRGEVMRSVGAQMSFGPKEFTGCSYSPMYEQWFIRLPRSFSGTIWLNEGLVLYFQTEDALRHAKRRAV